jgi:MFS family permease
LEKLKSSDNLRVVAIKSILSGMAFSMMRTIWQPFVLDMGAPMSTLGLLESLGGMRGVLPAPVQYIGGWLSDRLGRKSFIALGNLADLAAVCLYVLAATSGDWRWLLPAVVLAGTSLIYEPAQHSLIAESTPISRRGMAYSILMVSWIAPGIVAPAVGGYVADHWGFVPVFLVQLGLYGMGLLLILRYLRDTLKRRQGPLAWSDLRSALAGMVVPPRNLRSFYWAMALDTLVWGLGSALLFGMLSETYQFTTTQLGIMSSLLSITWTLFQLPIGRLIDRYGCKPMMVFSEALGIPIVAGWLFSSSFPAFAFLHACFGVMAATWVPAQRALLANSVSEHQRGEAMGRLAVFRGLIGFPAPYIGGLLYDHYGFQAPVLANLVGVFIVTGVLVFAIKEPSREEEGLLPTGE